jgi:hypothetical protein
MVSSINQLNEASMMVGSHVTTQKQEAELVQTAISKLELTSKVLVDTVVEQAEYGKQLQEEMGRITKTLKISVENVDALSNTVAKFNL